MTARPSLQPTDLRENDAPPLRVILPKKGRLREDFTAILGASDLDIIKKDDRHDYGALRDTRGTIAPAEILVQRAGDALENLAAGLADMAVVGFDSYREAVAGNAARGRKCDLTVTTVFNCSACALWIAAPPENAVRTPADLAGMRIATSYPGALRDWLDENNVPGVTVIARDGGIEDYVRLGAADAICDVVDSGRTLAANGLEKCLKLFDSSAVLVERAQIDGPEKTLQSYLLRQRLAEAAGVAPQAALYAAAPPAP